MRRSSALAIGFVGVCVACLARRVAVGRRAVERLERLETRNAFDGVRRHVDRHRKGALAVEFAVGHCGIIEFETLKRETNQKQNEKKNKKRKEKYIALTFKLMTRMFGNRLMQQRLRVSRAAEQRYDLKVILCVTKVCIS